MTPSAVSLSPYASPSCRACGPASRQGVREQPLREKCTDHEAPQYLATQGCSFKNQLGPTTQLSSPTPAWQVGILSSVPATQKRKKNTHVKKSVDAELTRTLVDETQTLPASSRGRVRHTLAAGGKAPHFPAVQAWAMWPEAWVISKGACICPGHC